MSLLLWRHSKASGYSSGQPALGDPAVGGELEQMNSGGPLQFQLFCDSGIVWLLEINIVCTTIL